MENNNHSNHFFHGFILGAIVGAAVIFFLFTDKGKKLMKIISEEGMEGIGEIKDIMQAETEEDESGESSFAKASEDKGNDQMASEEIRPRPKSPKRFFKGTKRK